jgi:hypothetical protein
MALKVRVGEQVMSLGEDRLEMWNASGGQSMDSSSERRLDPRLPSLKK